MEPILLILALTTLLCGSVAGIALWYGHRQATAYRELQGSILEREGERAAALEAAGSAERQLETAQRDLRQATDRATSAERDLAVMRAQMVESERRHADFETHQQRLLEAAKAAVLQTGNEMSTKLLADHKQESEASKKHAAEVTAKLFEDFRQVTGRVEAMHREGGALKEEMSLVMRALTNPSGAGKLAEVGLENLLKNFGFVAGHDFVMQYHIAGDEGGLRPDAVIFLPQNTVVVVDSKASKHVIALEAARGTEREAEVLDQFKRSMRDHAKSLAGKDYRNAIQESFRKAGRSGEIDTTISLMYFPSESAIERLREEDPNLYEYLHEKDILIVGRTTLHGVCSLARTRLHEARRDESQQEILEAVGQLLDNLTATIGHIGKMGNGLKMLAENYRNLVGSINNRALGRMRKLQALGVRAKPVPTPLPVYEVLKHEEVLDLAAEDGDGQEKVLAIR